MNAVSNRNSPKLHEVFERNQKVFLAASFAKYPFPKMNHTIQALSWNFLKELNSKHIKK